jgi:hypothetical protein
MAENFTAQQLRDMATIAAGEHWDQGLTRKDYKAVAAMLRFAAARLHRLNVLEPELTAARARADAYEARIDASRPVETCEWRRNGDEGGLLWEAACQGRTNYDDPEGWTHCPFCGKPLIEVPFNG